MKHHKTRAVLAGCNGVDERRSAAAYCLLPMVGEPQLAPTLKSVKHLAKKGFFMRIYRFTFLTSVQLLICSAALCAASSVVPDAPLVVDDHSHVVVMEYEAWWGPKAVTFQGTAAMPLLQSADMQAVGGGYDSADPAIIKQHIAWLEYMGVDAAISEVTNNVSCIFNTEWFVKKYVRNCTSSFRAYNRSIRDNTGNLYPAWTGLGTRLKLIPMLGGINSNVLIKDQD